VNVAIGQHERSTRRHRFSSSRPSVSISDRSAPRIGQAAPKQVAAHHGVGRQQAIRPQRFAAPSAIDLVWHQGVIEPKEDRPVADGARKADAIGRAGTNEDRPTRRTDDMSAGRFARREDAVSTATLRLWRSTSLQS